MHNIARSCSCVCMGGGWIPQDIREKVVSCEQRLIQCINPCCEPVSTPCYAVSGPVVPYHTSADDDQSGQPIPLVQSMANPSMQGKQFVHTLR